MLNENIQSDHTVAARPPSDRRVEVTAVNDAVRELDLRPANGGRRGDPQKEKITRLLSVDPLRRKSVEFVRERLVEHVDLEGGQSAPEGFSSGRDGHLDDWITGIEIALSEHIRVRLCRKNFTAESMRVPRIKSPESRCRQHRNRQSSLLHRTPPCAVRNIDDQRERLFRGALVINTGW